MLRLSEWYQTPLGCRVAEAERIALSTELASLRLGYVVCIGPLNGSLTVAPTLRQWQTGELGDVILDPVQLPFQAQSLDGIILVHVLELSESPAVVLSEAYQALRPEGRLLVLCFNPFGLWGLARLLGSWRDSRPPWCGRQWPAATLALRLRQMGFADIGVNFLCHRLPVQSGRFQRRLDQWETAVRRIGLGRLNAAVQLVVARRREPAGLNDFMRASLLSRREIKGSAQPASGYQQGASNLIRVVGLKNRS